MSEMFMKQEFAIVYVIFAVILLLETVQIWKYEERKAKWLKALFVTAFITVLGYSVSLFVNNFILLEAVNTMVFVAEGWLLYLFLGMCVAFTQEGALEQKRAPLFIPIVLIIDSIAMFVGVHNDFSLHFDEVWVGENLYAHFVPSAWFTVHLVVCYSIVAITAYVLLKKANEVSAPYAMAYVGMITVLVVVVILNACFLYQNWLLDVSILLYALVSILIRSYLYKFMNFTVRHHMKRYIVDNMDTPMLFFDLSDRLQIYNEQAEMMVNAREGLLLAEFVEDQKMETVFAHSALRHTTRNFNMVQDFGDRIYLMQGKELCDHTGRFVGTLFVYYDITREERMKDEATFNATHDKLTGLWNREFFFETARAKMEEYPDVEFLMIATDIENFKMFNAILGKKTGDYLLSSIADCCRRNGSDRRVYGHIGADRFAILIPKEDFSQKRFLKFEAEVFADKGYSLNVKNYNGICEIKDRTIDPEIYYDWAYMALETIKGNIGSDFAYFDETLRKDMIEEALTSDELLLAIREHQFVMFLQPQINSETGEVVGAEALARWESPKRGMVSPAVFIPLFEENGLITYLDYYIWEQACALLRKWQEEGHHERSISINISAKDFYLSDLFESVTGLVRKYNINPARLKLEITETAIVLDIEEQMALVKRFQDFGFLIEMDDFGSGYSSLNSLKNITVDILKLDMKFLANTNNSKRSETIIRSMVNLAEELGMPVIAEGVETKEQLDFLQRIGCNIVQGYYFSKPISVKEFEQYIEDKACVDMISRNKKERGRNEFI